jgi:O-antigen/teichoic acid export membrane protein
MSATIHYVELLKNNSRLILQYSINAIIPLLAVPHLAQIVGLNRFGQISFALAIAAYLMMFVQYVFHLTGPRNLASVETRDHKAVVVETILAKGILLASAYVFLIVFFLMLYFRKSLEAYIVISLIAMPLVGFLNSAWYLQYTNRFSIMLWGSALGAAVSLTIAFGFAGRDNESDLLWATLALVVGPLVASLTAYIVMTLALADRKITRGLRPLKLLRDGRELFLSQLVSAGYTASGVIIVGALAGPTAAGAFAVLDRIMNVIIAGLQLLHTAAYPKLTQTYKSQRSLYLPMILFILTLHSIIVVSLAAIIYFTVGKILLLLFNENINLGIQLLPLAMIWVWLSILGPLVTGYLVTSTQHVRVLTLNVRILLCALSLGLPGAYLFGAAGWLASLSISQFWLFRELFKIWGGEWSQLKRADAI